MFFLLICLDTKVTEKTSLLSLKNILVKEQLNICVSVITYSQCFNICYGSLKLQQCRFYFFFLQYGFRFHRFGLSIVA
jgi:hypothetical protein